MSSIQKINGDIILGDVVEDTSGDTTMVYVKNTVNGKMATVPKTSIIPAPTPYNSFKFLHKGFGNTDLTTNEIGDIFCGWSNDGTIRFSEAKWLGGALTDSNNFLPIVQTQI